MDSGWFWGRPGQIARNTVLSAVHTICALDIEQIVVGFGVDLAKQQGILFFQQSTPFVHWIVGG